MRFKEDLSCSFSGSCLYFWFLLINVQRTLSHTGCAAVPLFTLCLSGGVWRCVTCSSSSNSSLCLLILLPLLLAIFQTDPLSKKMTKMTVVLFCRYIFINDSSNTLHFLWVLHNKSLLMFRHVSSVKCWCCQFALAVTFYNVFPGMSPQTPSL